ncbi:MAG TPA: phosphoribosylformylglycinamidine synthase subunit PurS [Chitinophagaceae bacterium]|nr:phosphoribosylformylglycinamidine synthase subunit PurS [Chitinophagaceae bacterium]
MTYTALINVMPLKELLDPQGKAVQNSFDNLELNNIDNVRIGKHITLEVEADSKAKAKETAEDACKKLLANPVMEYFEITISED